MLEICAWCKKRNRKFNNLSIINQHGKASENKEQDNGLMQIDDFGRYHGFHMCDMSASFIVYIIWIKKANNKI